MTDEVTYLLTCRNTVCVNGLGLCCILLHSSMFLFLKTFKLCFVCVVHKIKMKTIPYILTCGNVSMKNRSYVISVHVPPEEKKMKCYFSGRNCPGNKDNLSFITQLAYTSAVVEWSSRHKHT